MSIDKPGVYEMPIQEYLDDPCPEWSISNSGIKRLLAEPFGGCPAKFKWAREHPDPPKLHFDIGHVAHSLVLGKGSDFVIVDAPDWRTKAAQAERDTTRDAGKTPILRHDFAAAQAMAGALNEHPFAGAAFRNGEAEKTMIWRDEEFGIWCRARLDWAPNTGTIFPDYKTAAAADPESISRATFSYGYFVQAALYLEGIKALGLCSNPSFLLVFQEKEPPHLVVCVQPTATQIEWGNIVNRRAKAVFAQCLRSGVWPGFADDVIALDMPNFAEQRLQRAHDAGLFDASMEFQRPLDAA